MDIEIYPAGQMGPPPRQFDLARTGVADLAFIYTALSPGRFPLTDILGAPFLFAKPDRRPISTADASLITTNLRDQLAHEYAGTEVLYFATSTALGLFMRTKLVKTRTIERSPRSADQRHCGLSSAGVGCLANHDRTD